MCSNNSVVRKLGRNVGEVTGRLVKLHYSFVSCLNQMFLHLSNGNIVAMEGAVTKAS